VLAKSVRLEPCDELAQVAARLTGQRKRADEDRVSTRGVAFGGGRRGGVEHLGDRGEMLDRPVVDQFAEAPALVLLGDEPLVERRPRVLVGARRVAERGGQSIIASRSAIATACVRVSASSFTRMCRTWLLTVSWLMNSREANVRVRHAVGEQLEDLALARCERVVAVPTLHERGHQRLVDEGVPVGDLLDRAQERLVGRFLEDVAAGARLEAAREECALAVGGEDEHRGLGDAL